jgi:transcriptional regulator with XRE-family HTH domain
MKSRKQRLLSHFASALKRLRHEFGLNQSKLSDISNIERKHVHRLEKGEVDPTIETIYKLADAMDLNVAAIIDRMEDESKKRNLTKTQRGK